MWSTGSDFDGRGSGGGISGRYRVPSWQLGVDMSRNGKGSSKDSQCPRCRRWRRTMFMSSRILAFRKTWAAQVAPRRWRAAFAALANQQATAPESSDTQFSQSRHHSAPRQKIKPQIAFTTSRLATTPGVKAMSAISRFPVTIFAQAGASPTGSYVVNLLALDWLQITPSALVPRREWLGGPIVLLRPKFSRSSLLEICLSPGRSPACGIIG